MFRQMMKAKIHRATVTEANLNYVGSVTIDQDLMELVDILPDEKVQIVNNNNGARFETYVIPGPAAPALFVSMELQPDSSSRAIRLLLSIMGCSRTRKPVVISRGSPLWTKETESSNCWRKSRIRPFCNAYETPLRNAE